MIEIDTNAREILLKWKRIFGDSIGARFDYSEAIRKADDYVVYPEYQDPNVRDKKLGRSAPSTAKKEVRASSARSSASSKSHPSSQYRRDKSGRFSSKPSPGRSRKSTSCR